MTFLRKKRSVNKRNEEKNYAGSSCHCAYEPFTILPTNRCVADFVCVFGFCCRVKFFSITMLSNAYDPDSEDRSAHAFVYYYHQFQYILLLAPFAAATEIVNKICL